jgi:hypothetical protein
MDRNRSISVSEPKVSWLNGSRELPTRHNGMMCHDPAQWHSQRQTSQSCKKTHPKTHLKIALKVNTLILEPVTTMSRDLSLRPFLEPITEQLCHNINVQPAKRVPRYTADFNRSIALDHSFFTNLQDHPGWPHNTQTKNNCWRTGTVNIIKSLLKAKTKPWVINNVPHSNDSTKKMT